MCGIVGIVGLGPAAPLLVEGLKRLEYRGYDSAGIATVVEGKIERRRAEGKIANLEALLAQRPLSGTTGIGHTRWATHGVPNEQNAHPHATQLAAVVHNGIIENFRELRAELAAEGRVFASETDSEAIVHLLTRFLEQGLAPLKAVQKTLERLEGAFALAIAFARQPGLLAAARRGSPLALGFGAGEMFIGSDALALAPLTRKILYLEDGDFALVRGDGAEVFDEAGRKVERPVRETALTGAAVGKGGYPHYMLKEIYEQPQAIGDTLASFIAPATRVVTLPALPFDFAAAPREGRDIISAAGFAAAPRITLVACGTSHHACMIARYWMERIAKLPAETDVASEFRYREPGLEAGGIALFVSQSGETADTLAALRHARKRGQKTIAVVNVPESTMAREADMVLHTNAGPEIGVASTKAFTTQLAVLACLTLAAARARGAIDAAEAARLAGALTEVPARAAEVLKHDQALREIAVEVARARDVLYLGRGTSYPVALEGALKLKEISYIHAEGHAAGEMKHGPIALIDDAVPVIVIAPSDALFEKTAANLEEVIARGGRVIFLSDAPGAKKLARIARTTVVLPEVDPFVAPILYAIPVQLLAYHVAVLKGTDVDKPRNLAKSVTVE
ncbi:MAG: glutamine--fructose-6-phosphate transaminase (isomerizing) [Rhodospirillales bacterium]|nr:glutamine--fructose-6-phosphate transaminase (isomerizing) [Rhodospirillales bacterium]